MLKMSIKTESAATKSSESKAGTFPLRIAFADALPTTYTPTPELVQGLLATHGSSVVYGSSNSGKTFFAIDIGAAIARGAQWMGRQTEPGLVVYVATESPVSVRNRVQAYQQHHGVRLSNFVIVETPVNLFKDSKDTEALIKTIKMIEYERKEKVRLIIGDTLARLSAGANENSGQDMGLVIEQIDRIHLECAAHFMLIHHSGKNAEAGMRGWSGVFGAVDTVIEITDHRSEGRCAEVTKVRDLGAKGQRIGFRLDVVTMGTTQWGTPATTCVVASAPAPERKKKLSALDGAILEFLMDQDGATKGEIVKHFAGRHEKGPIYRAIKELISDGVLHDDAGKIMAHTASDRAA